MKNGTSTTRLVKIIIEQFLSLKKIAIFQNKKKLRLKISKFPKLFVVTFDLGIPETCMRNPAQVAKVPACEGQLAF